MDAWLRIAALTLCTSVSATLASQQPTQPDSANLAPSKATPTSHTQLELAPIDPPAAQRPLGFYAQPPKVNFDVILFKRCGPEQFGTTKIDMPLDADYIAYHCQPIGHLIYFAYANSISNYNLPKGYLPWVDVDRYEFVAKVAPEDVATWRALSLDQRRVVMRAVLADTVKLKMSLETTPQPVYLLVAAKNGPKLTAYKPSDKQKLPDGKLQDGRVVDYVGQFEYGQGQFVSDLVSALTAHLDRKVFNRSQIPTDFQFNFILPAILGTAISPQQHWSDDTPSIAEGLASLGLKLQPSKIPVEQLVVDHIERPETE